MEDRLGNRLSYSFWGIDSSKFFVCVIWLLSVSSSENGNKNSSFYGSYRQPNQELGVGPSLFPEDAQNKTKTKRPP